MEMNLKHAALAVLPQPVINWHFLRQIEQSTINDEPDIACLPNIIKPDWICFDLGANIGRYTKHLSRLSAKVIAVEPTPMTYKVLSNTVAELRLTNVIVQHCACSAKSGTGSMEVPNIYEATLHAGADFPVYTLDQMSEHLPRVDFIKCDTEGHEIRVIQGALETIKRYRPMWLIETNWDSELFDLMETLGYQCYVEDKGSLRPRGFQERKTNYFFKGR